MTKSKYNKKNNFFRKFHFAGKNYQKKTGFNVLIFYKVVVYLLIFIRIFT